MENRLNILLNGNVIEKDVYDFSFNQYKKLKEKYSNETALITFITHLSMAMQRIRKYEIVSQLDEMIYEDLKKSDEFNNAVVIMDELLKEAPVQFPESEKQFLLLHLLNILINKEEKNYD